MAGETSTRPTHIAMGNGSTGATSQDTALVSELGRVAIDTTTRNSNRIEFTATFNSTALNGQTLRELGVFNASTGGTMYMRTTIADLDKTSNFEIIVTASFEVE